MSYDEQVAKLFISNFEEAHRTATSLASSIDRLSAIMPLKGNALDQLNEDDKDKVDAFRMRFSGLQDIIGKKLFRTILYLEDEQFTSQLDVLNMIEKRKLIKSYQWWKNLRHVRNLFQHEYPESENERAEALVEAYHLTPEMLALLDTIKNYASQKIGIDLSKFTNLT